jgi:CubicO group peptidase (beta-lactamase class C family)
MQQSQTEDRPDHERAGGTDEALLDDLLALWRELLGRPDLSADADFFASGGRSLLAIQLLQRLRRSLAVPIPLDALISAPTPRKLAERLTVLRAEHGAAAPATERPAGSELDRVLADVVAEGWHPGVQLYVSVAGEPVYHRVLGHREDDRPLEPDDVMPWFSGGKPVLAAALGELWRRGALDPYEPVTTYLPEFGVGGKAAITLRHLLTHCSGRLLPAGDGGADPYAVGYEQAVREAVGARLHPDDVPGRQPSYTSADTAWLVLSEVLRRVDGREFDRFVGEEIAAPLDATYHYGFSPEQLSRLGGRVDAYRRPRASQFSSPREAATAGAIRRLLASGRVHTNRSPGDGLWASARSMGRLYELLCCHAVGGDWSPAHDRLLDAATVGQMVRPQRPSFFEEAPLVDFGLGLTLESRRHGDEYAYYGAYTGTRSFGHQGHGSSPMAYADPEHRLVVAFNGNGLPGFAAGRAIWHRVSDAVYRELGLASGAATNPASN